MPRAPLPDALPGEFYVLEWDRDGERFVIYVDDEENSSYDLGGEVQDAMAAFRRWGLKDIGDRSIDMAREFGIVQAIPSQGRTLAIFDRDANNKRTVKFEEENPYARYSAAFRRSG